VVSVGEARAVAARWVAEHGARAPGFAGAFLSGSATWLPAEADLPVGSDVDVMVVTAADQAPPKLGKFPYGGVLLEVTYLCWDELPSAEAVLSSYHLAAALRGDTVVADPTGRLTLLCSATAAGYARLPWVRRRCEDAERRILGGLDSLEALDPSHPWHDQVTAWLFATGVTTHVLLTAGLRNPTVRLRYLAARTLLHEYGLPEFHEDLLRLLGCAHLTRERAAHHLEAMTAVFDATVPVARTPFFFVTDITRAARPVAVDGGRDLIERGRHHEAVFWIVATYARCLKLLAHDAPPHTTAAFAPAFAELLADLGIVAPADLRRRAQDVRAFLPRLREVTEAIIAANPDIDSSDTDSSDTDKPDIARSGPSGD
jgi:hypothetical protein